MDYPHQMERHVIFCPQSKRLLDRGVEGELLVVRYLFDHLDPRMVGDYRVLVNYYCPQHGLNALEIDLLVITTFGVFLLEVKNWLGHIDAYDDAWQLNGEKRDNIFGSILHKQHCVYSLMKKFQKLPLRVSVSSLVVLVQGTAQFHNHSGYDERGVVGLDERLLRALSSSELLHWRQNSHRLTDQEIQDLCSFLSRRHKDQGYQIVHHYRLLKKTRSTSLFEEFEAEHVQIPTRRVRLKCYRLRTLTSGRVTEKTIEQFKRGIEVVSTLANQTHILQTLDFFPDPCYCYLYYEVTEPIDGLRLDELAIQCQQQGRTLPLKTQMAIVTALCKALRSAHNHKEQGKKAPIYHRNICFETVFLIRNKENHRQVVKLADFNFAKFGEHTINPMYWGVPEYRNTRLIETIFTAPEVLRDASTASAASDIYALGILWYLLSILPEYDPHIRFDPNTDMVQIDRLTLPGEVRDLLKRMVAPQPEKRPQRVEEILDALKLLKALT
jgi:serine/threonine protein kinase